MVEKEHPTYEMTEEEKRRHRDMSTDGCPNEPPFKPTSRELKGKASASSDQQPDEKAPGDDVKCH